MPPDGYSSLVVADETSEQLVTVVIEYDCDSVAVAVEIALTITLQ